MKSNKTKALSKWKQDQIPFYKEKSFWQKRLSRGFHRKVRVKYPMGFEQRSLAKNSYRKALGFFNSKGQGLIEYLILVALMGVATIAIVRTLNQTVKSRFANSIYALQGRPQKAKTHNIRKEEYERSDLSDFVTGAASSDTKKRDSKK